MSAAYYDVIKRSVSMRDVAEYYGFEINSRTSKILCPFHDDHNKSMHIYSGDRGYYCFACGAHGDVIDFVSHCFNLCFMDACKKLNDDFHLGLPIGEKLSWQRKKEEERKYRERMEAIQKKRFQEQVLWTEYHTALDRYILLDRMIAENRPVRMSEPIKDEYIFAITRIDAAWNCVEEASVKLHEFEQRSKAEKENQEKEVVNKYAG